jgi:hypothetical protein
MLYLHLGPYFYSKAIFPENLIYLLHFLPHGNLILTPSIKIPLGLNAIFHSTLFTNKDLYFIEITDIPLAFCTIHIKHNKHANFTLESSVYISYYLNVTTSLLFANTQMFFQTICQEYPRTEILSLL